MSFVKSINPLFAKIITIGAIVLGLLVPLGHVGSLVEERSGMRGAAEERVAAGWGGQQTIGGPVLALPIDTRVIDPNDAQRATLRRDWRYLLPVMLDVSAGLTPHERHSGIYRVNAYTADIAMTARFSEDSLRQLGVLPADTTIAWSEAELIVPVGDLRGIREISTVSWNGKPLTVSPSLDGSVRGVSSIIELGSPPVGDSLFEFRGAIAGTKNLAVLPFGRTTTVRMRSAWPHPSFSGAFLPAHYALDAKGFDASWQILEVNRSFPQTWDGAVVSGEVLAASAFGVSLYDPVDIYQRNYRAIRYAVLFIAITFMCLFLWEQVARRRLHAMQYLLIGLALATFYLLLIALSEHLGFALAYALASLGQIGVLGVYLVGAMRARLAGSLAAAGIAVVYGALYLLVLSEQYALLLGALLLFVMLAAILLVTRRVDWHEMTRTMASGSAS
jgi:inner membrane protein